MNKELSGIWDFSWALQTAALPFLMCFYPLGWCVMEKDPNWILGVTGCQTDLGPAKSWNHQVLVWPFMSVPSGSQTVSQGHKAEDGECAKPSLCPGYRSWRKAKCMGKCLK